MHLLVFRNEPGSADVRTDDVTLGALTCHVFVQVLDLYRVDRARLIGGRMGGCIQRDDTYGYGKKK